MHKQTDGLPESQSVKPALINAIHIPFFPYPGCDAFSRLHNESYFPIPGDTHTNGRDHGISNQTATKGR